MAFDDGDEAFSGLERRLDELTELFQRRLLEDRTRAKAFEQLYVRLEAAEAALRGNALLPLARDVMHAVDRIDIETSDDHHVTVLSSIAEELVEALARQGIVEISSSTSLDPATHEWLSPPDGEGGGYCVVRRGYKAAQRVVRPVGVVPFDLPLRDPTESEQHDSELTSDDAD